MLVSWRGEDGLELHVLYRVVVRLETDQLALEARPLGQERQGLLRRRDRGGEAQAKRLSRGAILPAKESFGVKRMLWCLEPRNDVRNRPKAQTRLAKLAIYR